MRTAVGLGDAVQLSPMFEDGEELLAWAAGRGLEGIVSKRKQSTYREGTRAGEWVKVKIRCEQEFVVLGWKPGEGAMAGAAGSILLGVRHPEKVAAEQAWQFVGRCGTGGDYGFWQAFTHLPEDVTTEFATDTGTATPAELRDVTWVEPVQVVQVRFQRWTSDGRLWHPSVQGIRIDKAPLEVVREAVPNA
jgi:bifunctional non-homologous end joining protein LigD